MRSQMRREEMSDLITRSDDERLGPLNLENLTIELLYDSLRAALAERDALVAKIAELEEKYRIVCKVTYGEIPEDWDEAPDQGKD